MSFTFKGCKFTVSYYCFTFVAVILITNIMDGIIPCLAAAAIHELGHLSALLAFTRKPPKIISFTPFGINIISGGEFNTTTFRRILISLSGPSVNLITFIVLFCIEQTMENDFIMQNLVLGVFNLLPIIPLDGGCILSELLSLKFDCAKTNLISEIISCAFIIPMFCIGFLMIFQNPYNYVLLFIGCYLIFLFALRNRH